MSDDLSDTIDPEIGADVVTRWLAGKKQKAVAAAYAAAFGEGGEAALSRTTVERYLTKAKGEAPKNSGTYSAARDGGSLVTACGRPNDRAQLEAELFRSKTTGIAGVLITTIGAIEEKNKLQLLASECVRLGLRAIVFAAHDQIFGNAPTRYVPRGSGIVSLASVLPQRIGARPTEDPRIVEGWLQALKLQGLEVRCVGPGPGGGLRAHADEEHRRAPEAKAYLGPSESVPSWEVVARRFDGVLPDDLPVSLREHGRCAAPPEMPTTGAPVTLQELRSQLEQAGAGRAAVDQVLSPPDVFIGGTDRRARSSEERHHLLVERIRGSLAQATGDVAAATIEISRGLSVTECAERRKIAVTSLPLNLSDLAHCPAPSSGDSSELTRVALCLGEVLGEKTLVSEQALSDIRRSALRADLATRTPAAFETDGDSMVAIRQGLITLGTPVRARSAEWSTKCPHERFPAAKKLHLLVDVPAHEARGFEATERPSSGHDDKPVLIPFLDDNIEPVRPLRPPEIETSPTAALAACTVDGGRGGPGRAPRPAKGTPVEGTVNDVVGASAEAWEETLRNALAAEAAARALEEARTSALADELREGFAAALDLATAPPFGVWRGGEVGLEVSLKRIAGADEKGVSQTLIFPGTRVLKLTQAERQLVTNTLLRIKAALAQGVSTRVKNESGEALVLTDLSGLKVTVRGWRQRGPGARDALLFLAVPLKCETHREYRSYGPPYEEGPELVFVPTTQFDIRHNETIRLLDLLWVATSETLFECRFAMDSSLDLKPLTTEERAAIDQEQRRRAAARREEEEEWERKMD